MALCRWGLWLFLLAANPINAIPIWNNLDFGGDDYLVGTIHVGDKRLRDLPISIKKAIDAVDVIVVEFDLSATSTAQREFLMAKYGLLPTGKTLKTELSNRTYQRLKAKLFQYDVNIQKVAQFKPWFVSLMLIQQAYRAQGFDAKRGVDVQIVDYAKRQGKPIVGLESYELQLSLFDNLFERFPDLNYDDLILDTIEEIESDANLPMQMMDAWYGDNPNAFEHIYELTLKQNLFDKAAEQVLLSERNQNWVPIIEPLIANKSVMVAVGALHFYGPSSLKTLLKSDFSK